jgi:hypothetical protein
MKRLFETFEEGVGEIYFFSCEDFDFSCEDFRRSCGSEVCKSLS